MSQLSYRVEEMTCGHCKAAIEGAVLPLDGVNKIEVDLDTKIVTVDGGADDQIRSAIDDAGFDSVLVPS